MIMLVVIRETRTVHKVLMRRVLSDRCRITQEYFQYQGVEMYMMFQAYTFYNSHY